MGGLGLFAHLRGPWARKRRGVLQSGELRPQCTLCKINLLSMFRRLQIAIDQYLKTEPLFMNGRNFYQTPYKLNVFRFL